jgi:hypothetical protein
LRRASTCYSKRRRGWPGRSPAMASVGVRWRCTSAVASSFAGPGRRPRDSDPTISAIAKLCLTRHRGCRFSSPVSRRSDCESGRPLLRADPSGSISASVRGGISEWVGRSSRPMTVKGYAAAESPDRLKRGCSCLAEGRPKARCVSPKSLSLALHSIHSREGGNPGQHAVSFPCRFWVPAFAGTSG